MQPIVPSVFDEMEQSRPVYTASAGQRFANYIIDFIMAYLFVVIASMVIGLAGALFFEGFIELLVAESIQGKLLQYLLTAIFMTIYFTVTETLFKGRTIGKLVTGTKAVREDGSEITVRDAFIRSVCRLIPFEPFSAFSHALWHDRLSKTMVIRTR